MSYKYTMNLGKHKKRKIVHPRMLRGAASALFVPPQGTRAQGNSPHPGPLSTAVLDQTTYKLPKHHASASGNSQNIFAILKVH